MSSPPLQEILYPRLYSVPPIQVQTPPPPPDDVHSIGSIPLVSQLSAARRPPSAAAGRPDSPSLPRPPAHTLANNDGSQGFNNLLEDDLPGRIKDIIEARKMTSEIKYRQAALPRRPYTTPRGIGKEDCINEVELQAILLALKHIAPKREHIQVCMWTTPRP